MGTCLGNLHQMRFSEFGDRLTLLLHLTLNLWFLDLCLKSNTIPFDFEDCVPKIRGLEASF